MKVILLTLTILLFVCGSAHAQSKTGEMIQGICKHYIEFENDHTNFPRSSLFDVAYCAGFIDGAIQGYGYWQGYKGEGEVEQICFPSSVSTAQIVKGFVKYLDDHPELLHQPAVIPFATAMEQAFPCKK